MARVTLEVEAARQFQRPPTAIKARVEQLLIRLANWPNVSGARPLRGKLAGHVRLRTGDYRLQFRVEGTDMLLPNGDRIVTTYSNQTRAPIAPSPFEFKPPAGTEVTTPLGQ